MNFVELCHERGYFHQCTDEESLRALMDRECVPAYIGFDCTATSLHVGSLLQIMLLRWLQKCGHKPIVLMGGGTTKVGDPSGKDKSRKMLTDADIQSNMDGIKSVFEKFLCFGDGETDAVMVNNDDWLKGINYIEFLRDYGKYFSVNRMMTMESVKQRLERESHLSFLEFNYMILQAYDFVKLAESPKDVTVFDRIKSFFSGKPIDKGGYNCRLQLGGSDQWGNIVNGVELFRKSITPKIGIGDTQEEAELDRQEKEAESFIDLPEDHPVHQYNLFGLTSPLITTSSGAKMGKTADGAIWLDESLLSAYDYWQFWRNTEDDDVIRFLKMFTELPLEQIAEYENWVGTAQINDAKIILANEATTMLHGAEAAKAAAETAKKVFEQGGVGGDLPEVMIAKADLEAGIPAFKLFNDAGLESSGGKARKLIQGGGAKVNDQKVDAEDQSISMADMTDDGYIKLSAGKKRHVLVKAA